MTDTPRGLVDRWCDDRGRVIAIAGNRSVRIRDRQIEIVTDWVTCRTSDNPGPDVKPSTTKLDDVLGSGASTEIIRAVLATQETK